MSQLAKQIHMWAIIVYEPQSHSDAFSNRTNYILLHVACRINNIK